MLNASKTLLGLAGLLSVLAGACSSPSGTAPMEPNQQPDSDGNGEVAQVNRIAYVSPNGDLFTVDPDGGGLSQLTGGLQAGSSSEGSVKAPIIRRVPMAWKPIASHSAIRVSIWSAIQPNNTLPNTPTIAQVERT